MGAFLSQIVSLLTVPPGNFIFHVVLVFSVAGTLQLAFTHWRSSEFPQARRTMLGLGLLLAVQVLLFGVSGLAWQGLINSDISLPVLDRAFSVFSIIWVTWLWAFPEPSRPADAGAALLSVFLVAVTGFALLTWGSRFATQSYNFSVDDLLWQAASIGLILIGGLTLLVRRPNGFGNGLAMLVILLLGHIGHLLFQESGNYSGVIRLAYVAAYPILLTLPQRFPAPAGTMAGISKAGASENGPAEQKRYSADPENHPRDAHAGRRIQCAQG